MIGIIDVGGGNSAAFADGVLDYLIENNINVDYFIGVSAGAANGASFVAKQSGRNLKFYTEYNLSARAIGPLAFLCSKGSFVDMDYIYGTLSNEGGKCPLDYDALMESPTKFVVVATDVDNGNAVYFDKSDIKRNNYGVLCASSARPIACKPYSFNGRRYYDGYVCDPIPVDKALSDGCDKIIVLLANSKERFRSGKGDAKQAEKTKKYPAISKLLSQQAQLYNDSLKKALELEKEGKALVLCPKDNMYMSALDKDKTKINALYQYGYQQGKRVTEFLSTEINI